MTAPAFIDESECSDLTGIPVRTLQDWRTEAHRHAHGERMPFLKLGRLVRYDRDAVIEWMRSQSATAETPGGNRANQ